MATDPRRRRDRTKPLWILLALLVAAVLAAVGYRPDRPIATIEPGSSPGPAFAVQIIRPRLGLPLGGIAPPRLFGLEEHLGFDSASAGATIDTVAPGFIRLDADGWDVVLVRDGDGRVAPGTQAVFEFQFENHLRRVRCLPDDPAVGTFGVTMLPDAGELSGSFRIELAHCEDAETGEPLGWPPKPLVLHGSFDRLRRSGPEVP